MTGSEWIRGCVRGAVLCCGGLWGVLCVRGVCERRLTDALIN